MSLACPRVHAFMLALTLAPVLGAQEPAPKPLSPGEVVLLSNSADPTATAIALKRTLMSSDPAARAAAARVVAVTPHGSLRGDLIGALEREQNPATGAEMVRDLLLLSGAADESVVDFQVRRFGPPGTLALAEWLAREQPQQFAKREAELTTLAGDWAKELATIVRMAAAQHASEADAVYRAWMPVAPAGGWDRVLRETLTVDGVPTSLAPLISDALDSTRQIISEETVWFVLASVLRKSQVPGDIVTKASRARDGVTAWEAFGRELLARTSGALPASTDRHDLVQREGPAHLVDIRRLHAAEQLTGPERDAVLAIAPLPKDAPAAVAGADDLGHTVLGFAPGVIGGTIAAAGCQIGRGDQIGFATIVYALDGRPRRITFDPTGLSPRCQAAVTALARTSLLPAQKPAAPDTADRLMVPLNAEFIACVDAPPAPVSPRPVDSLAHIDAPKKTKNVPPTYPPFAMNTRIQGVVVIEATITTSGCITNARVLRSIPYLDRAAMQAVTRWQFQPARVNGSPVPVIMTVTVNFTLQ